MIDELIEWVFYKINRQILDSILQRTGKDIKELFIWGGGEQIITLIVLTMVVVIVDMDVFFKKKKRYK